MPDDDISMKLSSALHRRGFAVTGLRDLHRLSGGAMQESWSFEVLCDGDWRRMVLRRLPAGAIDVRPGNISLALQAAVMKATKANNVPGPDVLAVLNADDDLGAGFVMNFISGETIPRRILNDPSLAAIRPALARQCGEILARIHSTPLSGLEAVPVKTADRSIEDLRIQYESAQRPRPVLELAFKWLERNPLPPVDRACLVHADFRNGNLIVDQSGIAAVLDWERTFVGDPAYDAGWLTMGSWRFGQIDRVVGGFGALADLQQGYRSVAAAPLDPRRVKFWRVFGSLDWGIGTLAFSREAIETDRSIERAAIGRRCSEAEIDLLRLIGGEEAALDG